MQAERATGTLTIDNGGDSCSLYFLFGHLFHASGPGGQGEEVVIDALGWEDGSYQFDPRAKLPAEETIKASPGRADRRRGEPARSGRRGLDRCLRRGPTPRRRTRRATRTRRPAASLPEPVEEPAYAVASGAPAPEPAAETYARPRRRARAGTRCLSSSPPRPPEPVGRIPLRRSRCPTSRLHPRPHPPAPRHRRTAPGHLRGWRASSSVPPVRVYPLPSGRAHYEGLKSAFVDFPRLLRTLRSDRHTGYVNLSGNGYSA